MRSGDPRSRTYYGSYRTSLSLRVDDGLVQGKNDQRRREKKKKIWRGEEKKRKWKEIFLLWINSDLDQLIVL